MTLLDWPAIGTGDVYICMLQGAHAERSRWKAEETQGVVTWRAKMSSVDWAQPNKADFKLREVKVGHWVCPLPGSAPPEFRYQLVRPGLPPLVRVHLFGNSVR